MNADGSHKTKLTETSQTRWARGNELVWSPDGKKIAFSSDRDNLDFEIYVMRAVTEGPNNVPDALTNNSQSDFFPDWQPLP